MLAAAAATKKLFRNFYVIRRYYAMTGKDRFTMTGASDAVQADLHNMPF